MMQSAMDLFLRRFVTVGRLTVHWPDGRTRIYGGAPGSGPEARVALRDRRTCGDWRSTLGVGEAYMEGAARPRSTAQSTTCSPCSWPISGPTPTGSRSPGSGAWAARMFRLLDQFNTAVRARLNVAHHYDLNGQLYSLFLDRDRQYSCAYFWKRRRGPRSATSPPSAFFGARHRVRLGRHGADA